MWFNCRLATRSFWLLKLSVVLAMPVQAQTQAPTQAPTQVTAGFAVILNSRDASVSLIDTKTYTEVGRVDVGKEPHHLYPTPDGKSLIVANAASDDLHFLDPLSGQIQKRIRSISDPYQIGYSPDNKWFVSNALRLNRVDLYTHVGDEFKLIKRIPLARAPSHLWYSADSKFVFVTLQDSDEVAAIDLTTQTVAWRIKVGRQPAGIVMTPDDRHLLVGIMGEDYVQVIDWRAQTLVKRIVTGKGAHNFRGLGDKRHLFVSNRVSGTISKLDMSSLSVVDQYAVPGGPDCMEVTTDQKQLWVTSRWAKQVAVIDLDQRKVIRRIEVGRSPHGIYFHQRAPLL